MKSIALFVVLILFVAQSLQHPKLLNCPPDFVPSTTIANSCGVFTCDGPTKIIGKGCATYRCAENKTVGYKERDDSKTYPECCGGPICRP